MAYRSALLCRQLVTAVNIAGGFVKYGHVRCRAPVDKLDGAAAVSIAVRCAVKLPAESPAENDFMENRRMHAMLQLESI